MIRRLPIYLTFLFIYLSVTRILYCVAQCKVSSLFMHQECPTIILDLSIPNAIEPALNCTVINGNLIITHLSHTQCREGGLSLRSLVEILGTLTVEHSSCHGDLSFFLPNLAAIHGLSLFSPYVEVPGLPDLPPYAILIHHTALSGIGLVCLRVLGHRGALLLDNPQMCYVDTVGWHLLIPSVLNTPNFYINISSDGPHPQPAVAEKKDILMKAGLYEMCANPCPPGCERAFVDHLPRTFCWSRTHCQPVCAPECAVLSRSCHIKNTNLCCHQQCLGGCSGPSAQDCLVCRNFQHNGTCIESCPPNFYGLFGRHCVTKESCLAMPVPAELLRNPSEYNRPHTVLKRFAIHGSNCIPICPDGFHRSSSSGVCSPCVGNCKDNSRDCGDIIIYQQSDIASAMGCVTARSVLISLRTGQDDLRSLLVEAFSQLRVIHRSLRIIRSDALLSLSFLRHLTDIYGREAPVSDSALQNPSMGPNITALEVTWNGNLDDVLPTPINNSFTSEKLVIHSGSVEFSVNSKLCPDIIMRFLRERVVLGRELMPSELYLITTSNGEHALCKAVPLNVIVADTFQTSVFLHVEHIAWNDPRQVLPAIISYGRRETQESTFDFQERTFCDSAWNEVELNCRPPTKSLQALSSSPRINTTGKGSQEPDMLTCTLDSLSPATSYSAFITIATLSKHEGARSQRFHFTTKPATPSPPTALRAVSAGPASIQLSWQPPQRPNGEVVEYHISHWRMSLEKSDFLTRDACYGSSLQPLNGMSSQTGGPIWSVSQHLSEQCHSEFCCSSEAADETVECPDSSSLESHSRSSSRSALIEEEQQRREMIRFEDELHKIILIPREPHPIAQPFQLAGPREQPAFATSKVRIRRETGSGSGSISSRAPATGTIRVAVSDLRVGASADSTKTLTYIVGKLEHFTEYLFLISACHEPHDELGNPVFPSNRSDDYDDEVSLSPGSSDSHNTWCSPPVRISQRTQAIRYADEIDSRSLRALTPDARLSSMTNQTLPADSNEKAGVGQSESFIIGSQEAQRQPEADGPPPSNKQSVTLFWLEPCSPNGLILYYWLQYRRIEKTDLESSNSTPPSTVPWFTICVPPQYYKQQPKAAALTNATVVHLPPDDPVFGVSSSLPPPIRSAMEPPYLPSDLLCRTAAPPKIVFTDLPFLRPGFYEWQIMAVSLAGNGSWTDSHFFEVHDSRPESLSRTLKPAHLSSILLVTLFLVGTVVGFAVWFDYRARKRRLNALLSQNAEYLQSLLLDRFSDEWEVDPKDLTYDADAAIGHGSFGMVFRGRLTRLTTPAAEYLQVPLASAGPGGNKALKLERSSSNAGETTVDKGHSLATRYSVLLTLLRGHFSHLTKKTSSPPHAIGVDVAVKVLSPGSTLEDVREFLSEASHMKQFSCNHIVRLLGIVSKQVLLRRQPIVIMELMEHGDLATYLRQRMAQDDYSEGCIAPELAIKWAAEIADGMAYLSFKGFVHRDLAARNCLVGSTLTVKIGDFGLTRDISDNHYYRKQGRARLPVRWMAPEALLEAYFTSKSDVWSYGVVLWEIATFAALPFSGLSHEEVISLVTSGGHLGKQGWPPRFPPVLLHIMSLCWRTDKCLRPSFGDILHLLKGHLSDTFLAASYFFGGGSASDAEADVTVDSSPETAVDA
uniref:receptor protein-tyrosine kinase n=1 Tax=Schistocephalus solidus TaxID=70667 RepID=A0A0X3PZ74_SCHSO